MLLFSLLFYANFKVKIKIYIYVLSACYLATFIRVFINNNFIVSIIGSFFLGFVIPKRLSQSRKKILLSGFLSCFTSFSGFIYFLYKILNQGDWIDSIASRLLDELPDENVNKNNTFDETEVDDFEFNQDNYFQSEIESPGWKRYQKRIKN